MDNFESLGNEKDKIYEGSILTKKLITKKLTTSKCFFIAPLGEVNSDRYNISKMVYNVIIAPTLAYFGIEKTQIIFPNLYGDIHEAIRKHLEEADICFADISELNPNVFWEIGYRSKINKPIIYLAATGTEAPFDIYHMRIIRYRILYNYTDLRQTRYDLYEAIKHEGILQPALEIDFSTYECNLQIEGYTAPLI